jgi:hypothetical protein
VVYDSWIHGDFERVAQLASQELGGTPASGVDEKLWTRTYLTNRRDYLANNPNSLLQRMVYRPDTFLILMQLGNWAHH